MKATLTLAGSTKPSWELVPRPVVAKNLLLLAKMGMEKVLYPLGSDIPRETMSPVSLMLVADALPKAAE